MANTHKDIIIVPYRGDANNDPVIKFSTGDVTSNLDMNVRFYAISNGTLSFEGTAGQLFSVTNDLTGTIFSVNDISGIPSLEIDANGKVSIAHFGGNVGIGTSNAQYKLDVAGNANISGTLLLSGINVATTLITAFTQANLAFTQANNVGDAVTTTNNIAIAAFTQANTAATIGSSAFDKANTIVISSNVTPTNPSDNELWWDTDAGTLFIYYNDGDSSQWVETSPQVLVENPIGTYTLNGNLVVTGDTIVQGTLFETSDVRLKTDIETIKSPLNTIKKIRGVDFIWKKTGDKSMGVIAQEIENVLPQLISHQSDDMKSVNYSAIIGLLIESIKELEKKIDGN
jgi:hypothetical protein